MKLQLKNKIISKEMLRENVYTLLKREKKLDLMNVLDEGIYKAASIEDALNVVARYIDIC